MKPTDPRPPAHTPPGHGAAHHGHHHHSADEMHNEDVAHEHSDINVRAILMFTGGLAAVTALVFVLMWGLFNGLERYAASNDPQLSPVAQQGGQLPPEPRLLTNEPEQLRRTREAENKLLQNYGWADQAAGVAHISIEDAKKKIVERGLPVRPGDTLDTRFGTNAPAMGEASGGRMLGAPMGEQRAIAPKLQPGASEDPRPGAARPPASGRGH